MNGFTFIGSKCPYCQIGYQCNGEPIRKEKGSTLFLRRDAEEFGGEYSIALRVDVNECDGLDMAYRDQTIIEFAYEARVLYCPMCGRKL